MSEGQTSAPIDFALLGHPASYDHLGDLFRHSKPDFNLDKLNKHKATLSKIFEWTPSFVSKNPLEIETATGRRLSGRLIICAFLPEALDSPKALLAARKKTMDACGLAKGLGAPVVGLGGFTSIVGGAQGADLAEKYGLAVTSGNTLTAALAIAQLETLLERLRWSLEERTLAIIGATGDIGRACSSVLLPRARRVVLIARNRAKLEELRAEFSSYAHVETSTDVSMATQANVIVAATSAAKPVLAAADLMPGTVVCDIGYPKNLLAAAAKRDDILAFGAGLAQLPFELDITFHTQLPRSNLMYGCFSEAILLALLQRHESFSTGQGRISQERMGEIIRLARENGLTPAPLYQGHEPITDDDVGVFLAHCQARNGN